VVDALGSGMLLPFTVLYFTTVAGLSPETVGLVLGLAGLVAMAAVPVSGALIDEFGAKRMVIGCFCLATVGYVGYLGVTAWWAVLLVTGVAQVADRAARPAKRAFMASIVEAEDRVRLMAFQRSVRNVGYGVGGLITAGLLELGGATGYQIAIVINGISYLAAAALAVGIPVTAPASNTATATPTETIRNGGYRQVLGDRRYVVLALLNTLVQLHATALTVGMPLWVGQHTAAPLALVGVLFTLNTVLVVLLQVRLSGNISRPRQTPAVYLRSAAAFAVAATAYTVAGALARPLAVLLTVLVVAVLAHTAAELYAAIGEWAVSVSLAPERLRGRYLSLFALSSSLHLALGPPLITLLIARTPHLAWLILAGVLASGCLISAWLAANTSEPDDDTAPLPTG
jgi:MFS family permease